MKNKLILISGILLAGIGAAALPAQESAVQDVTIQGEFTHKFGSERPKLQIEFDINKVVIPTIKTNRELLQKRPEELLDLQSSLPEILNSGQTISAHLNSIIAEPVSQFRIDREWDFKIVRWELIISDAKGESFYKFDGRGNLPEIISWSGRDHNRQMIQPGKWYSYLMRATDMVGRVHTVVGKPFNFDAIMHQEEHGLILSMSDIAMFTRDPEASEITEQGKLLLMETADMLKKYYTLPIRVEVYANNLATAGKRSKNIAEYLTELLIVPDDRIKTANHTAYVANQRINIVIVNK